MKDKSDELALFRLSIEPTTSILDFILNVKNLSEDISLFHIVTHTNENEQIKKLADKLHKAFPDTKIVFLKHNDPELSYLYIYSLEMEEKKEVSDILLHKLYNKYQKTNTDLEEYRTQLLLRYFTDNLTNLPNLYQLRKDLQHEEENSTLVLLKVDDFQTINNFYGFVVGDFVMEYISDLLKKLFDKTTLYRLSGTEFAVRLDEVYDFYRLKEYLKKLYTSLQSFSVTYRDIRIYVNFTLSASASKDNTNIFSKVSMALKYAEDNSLPFWIYEDAMNFENKYEKNLILSQVIRDAVANNRVIPYYQAIYDNKKNIVNKFEALARLIDDEGNVISPEVFIPISKSLKIYNKITQTIIDKVFAEFEHNGYEFSINLSIEDIMNSEVFGYIVQKLIDFPDPSRVTFELLESEAILDFKKIERFIAEIKRRGAKIAIDDFGSGYSNFAYVVNLKVDYIKIDGSLIKQIATDKTSLMTVEMIVGLAKKLGIETVAEYVFSSTIFTQVKNLGIDYTQGFYIDKPSLEYGNGKLS